MKILVTGIAGFIGFHVARRLLQRGDSVVGVDVVNDYYSRDLKEDRLAVLEATALQLNARYEFIRANLADLRQVETCFARHSFDRVIHLAAQAGVRYSIENPGAYVESNIVAFCNILECCRHSRSPHLTYASTSSVYGANTKLPYAETDPANHPLQFYAATKRANELMAHSYSHLFRLPTTGLRFFTVYGPWGRPDMAYFQFTRDIMRGVPIKIFNNGHHSRDFTYIDDIVDGVVRASDSVAEPSNSWHSLNPDPATSCAPFRIFNIGNERPASLLEYVEAIEDALGMKAQRIYVPMQPGDAIDTYADTSRLAKAVGFEQRTSIREGIRHFVDWYRSYYSSREVPL